MPELRAHPASFGCSQADSLAASLSPSVKSFKAPSTNIPVQKWRSTKTGLSFVWAGVEGPLVSGTFTIPTEIFDDTGRPHTLE